MKFDENMTVEVFKKELFKKLNISPILINSIQLIFNGKVLRDKIKTMKELGIRKFDQIQLMATQAGDS